MSGGAKNCEAARWRELSDEWMGGGEGGTGTADVCWLLLVLIRPHCSVGERHCRAYNNNNNNNKTETGDLELLPRLACS